MLSHLLSHFSLHNLLFVRNRNGQRRVMRTLSWPFLAVILPSTTRNQPQTVRERMIWVSWVTPSQSWFWKICALSGSPWGTSIMGFHWKKPTLPWVASQWSTHCHGQCKRWSYRCTIPYLLNPRVKIIIIHLAHFYVGDWDSARRDMGTYLPTPQSCFRLQGETQFNA